MSPNLHSIHQPVFTSRLIATIADTNFDHLCRLADKNPANRAHQHLVLSSWRVKNQIGLV